MLPTMWYLNMLNVGNSFHGVCLYVGNGFRGVMCVCIQYVHVGNRFHGDSLCFAYVYNLGHGFCIVDVLEHGQYRHSP